ncbi:MAG: L-seryl-tRNA(Sec) selenium transferase [Armatimonadetes bacterium]|nr:L-seryl-tRNA(Sec) selenium transferase [Armatimonadota bacterium]
MRLLPAIDKILSDPPGEALIAAFPRTKVVEALQEAQGKLREELKRENGSCPTRESLAARLVEIARSDLESRFSLSLRPVVNGTGVILHTNLGRALLPPSVVQHLTEVSTHYTNLELDLDSGERGHRSSHLEGILCDLTGAESALVVNNNAAAMYLILDTFARGKEVVISRGELVEIGGSFRIPDVLAKSGARLVEVGATNKTRLRDYEHAITENTALLLKVHTSNYKIMGFVETTSRESLAALGKERGIPVVDDLGSGALVDLSRYGLPREPTVQESIRSGMDLAAFSGDKLLGGPQAGIIAGRKSLVQEMEKNPMMRALRVSKLVIAGLESLLQIYLREEDLTAAIPFYRMVSRTPSELEETARALASRLQVVLGNEASVSVLPGTSEIGAGSLPTETLPTFLVALAPTSQKEEHWAGLLREQDILVRRCQGELLLDVRTILQEEQPLVLQAFSRIAKEEGPGEWNC